MIQHQKNGEVGTFKWLVHPNTNQVACSPFFEKWNRRWRLFFAKKGYNLEYGLEYVHAISPIYLALRLVRRHLKVHSVSYVVNKCHIRTAPGEAFTQISGYFLRSLENFKIS